MPNLTKSYFLNFYGGEPLLAFELIKEAVSWLSTQNKKLMKRARYALTTNGSLLRDEIIQFLSKHRFSVGLSFDSLAQEVSRKKGSFEKVVSSLEELLHFPSIYLETNSVFTPLTVDQFSESLEFLILLGVPNIRYSLSFLSPWNQIALSRLEKEFEKLRKILLAHYDKTGRIPVTNFRDSSRKGVFSCGAGQNQLAVTSEAHIWGCYLFADYFKGKEKWPEYQKYFFGHLNDFIQNHKKIYSPICANYAQFSQDNFQTPEMKCFLCQKLENCAICPINASFSGVSLGRIPPFICRIQKIKIREKERFWEEIQKNP